MRQIRQNALQREFIAWQCRIRQISLRDLDGQPMPAMRPTVSSRKGEMISPAMMALLVPDDPGPSLSFLRFQIQKTSDPKAVRDAVTKYLASEFYQLPELFTDQLTAVFSPGSQTAARMLKLKQVLLGFEQYSQTFRMFCKVNQLPAGDEAREFSLWQARSFNPNIPGDATVLSFRPDWKTAVGSGM
jgi:hypothetical protein